MTKERLAMNRLRFLFALFFFVAAGSARGDDTHLTVYNADLGLVRQVLVLDGNAKEPSLRLAGLPEKLIAPSVCLRPADEGTFRVLEQTFEYDLASPERILGKYRGKTIEILTAQGEYLHGKLLSRFQGSLVLETDRGIRIVPWSDEILVTLKELPQGLVTDPTLVWELGGLKAGKHPAELTYLTAGLDWEAVYVGILNQPATSMHLDGWASVTNESGADFTQVRLKLVAGEVQRTLPQGLLRAGKQADFMLAEAASTTAVQERELFEYHVYELPGTVTLLDQQAKQILLFPRTVLSTERQFVYNGQRHPTQVGVRLTFKNNPKVGPAKPFPAGILRVYQNDGADLAFLGEDRIDHTPRNGEVKALVGSAFDLAGKRKVVESRRISDRSERQTVEIALRNHKEKEAVTILVEESLPQRDWRIENASHKFTKEDAHLVEFLVSVPSDSTTVLNYTVLYTW